MLLCCIVLAPTVLSGQLRDDLALIVRSHAPSATQNERRPLATLRTGSPIQWTVLSLIGLYRELISPQDGPTCSFTVSCSAYCTTAIRAYGAAHGLMMCADRLQRCNGLSGGHYAHDPVSGLAIDLPMETYRLRIATDDRER